MAKIETVLITGGAGSLGKAFVNRLHKEYEVIVIDNNEWSLAELQKEYPSVQCLLMDFGDWQFTEHPAHTLIHCGAYKHVNLGESNVPSFIDNNITKTDRLFREARRFGMDILFISTDKAVEPVSLYGFTKAIGEKLAKYYGGAVARLGNILNSSGSVIPVWEQAIKDQAPIPITDERMTRYFINDFEAVDQIWSMFKSGEELIIPKCKEIRVLDLLSEVLKRHGYDSYAPGVEIIGMRPGERLTEKLRWDDEA